MSRFILLLELVLGTIALSIWLTGGSPFLYLAAAPFILVLAIPVLTVFAVWEFPDIRLAWRDVFSRKRGEGIAEKSYTIWIFSERMAYMGALIGLVLGLIIFFTGIGKFPLVEIVEKGKQALLGAAYGLLAGLVLNSLASISRKPDKTPLPAVPENALQDFTAANSITKREKEIIRMVISGNSNREISQSLFISEDTVKNHIYNIFQKTGIKSRSELQSRVLIKREE